MKNLITRYTLAVCLIPFLASVEPARADVIQVNASLATGHFVRGVDLTNDRPAVFLGVDWSLDNGVFSGAECYRSDLDDQPGLKRGCQFYLGYFLPLNKQQAISLSLRHSDYVSSPFAEWDYTELAVDWHPNRNTTLSVSATDDWLGRGHSMVALNGSIQRAISQRINASLGAGVMQFESSADIDAVGFASIGVSYEQSRWSTSLSATAIDRDIRQLTHFALDQPEINLTLSYRLY